MAFLVSVFASALASALAFGGLGAAALTGVGGKTFGSGGRGLGSAVLVGAWRFPSSPQDVRLDHGLGCSRLGHRLPPPALSIGLAGSDLGGDFRSSPPAWPVSVLARLRLDGICLAVLALRSRPFRFSAAAGAAHGWPRDRPAGPPARAASPPLLAMVGAAGQGACVTFGAGAGSGCGRACCATGAKFCGAGASLLGQRWLGFTGADLATAMLGAPAGATERIMAMLRAILSSWAAALAISARPARASGHVGILGQQARQRIIVQHTRLARLQARACS